jgi:hypothetical protein
VGAGSWAQTAADMDEALSQLWTLADEAGAHGTLGLFLWMAKRIRAQSPRGGAHHESCSPPRRPGQFFPDGGFGHVGLYLCGGSIKYRYATGSMG